MIAFAFWIKAPGAPEAAGPLTFPELRELMQSGLVTDDTLLADDDFRYHPLRDFTSLWEALNDPSVDDVVREPATKMAWREEIVRERDTNTSAPILNPTADDVIDFAAVRRGERGFAVYDVLALNRSKEPEKIIRMLPWYKQPRMVDLRRTLTYAAGIFFIYGVLIPAGLFCFSGANALPAAIFSFFFSFFIIGGFAWHIFFIDYHWHGKDSNRYRNPDASPMARVLSLLKRLGGRNR